MNHCSKGSTRLFVDLPTLEIDARRFLGMGGWGDNRIKRYLPMVSLPFIVINPAWEMVNTTNRLHAFQFENVSINYSINMFFLKIMPYWMKDKIIDKFWILSNILVLHLKKNPFPIPRSWFLKSCSGVFSRVKRVKKKDASHATWL